MKLVLVLLAALAAQPVAADLWTLRTGPEAAPSIPLDPVQPVDSWRGQYSNGDDKVWIYATRSPQFFPPAAVSVRRVGGTVWSVVGFFPAAWTPAQQTAWLDLWVTAFQSLQTLPDPGWPIVFPAVLRRG